MSRIHAALTQLKHDEKGVAALDYGLTAALVAVVLLLVLGSLGGSLGATFGGVASSFGTGPFSGGQAGGGQAVPAAGTSVCERSSQPLLPAAPGCSCQRGVSGPPVTVGNPAISG